MAYSVIKKPSNYFNTKLYTGSTSQQSITGVGFQPDLCWFKNRATASRHQLYDAVRGTTKLINSDSADAEQTVSFFSSFDSDGYTIPSGSSALNGSGESIVSWNWLGSNTTASNTDGDITSTISVNTISGFSIVTYTGTGTNATVGHGLGVAPKMYIVKRRDAGGASWCVYHASVGNTGALFLNDTAATSVSSSYWNNTSPTANVFTVGGANQAVNASSGTYVAYCFAEKQGFSKFGSYTGNGSTDGTFVYTGFKPAFIMVKDYTTAGNNWFIWDNKRDGYNILNRYLRPNLSDAEGNYDAIDILSNGFKNRNTSGSANGSGTGYIYMAFAEEPLVGDNPATAR